MTKILLTKDQLNTILKEQEKEKETTSKKLIDVEKLKEYAKGIAICCAGEYGVTFLNEEENHIYIMLGDSNPFDDSGLEMYIKEYICDDWKSQEKVKVTIECESYPSGPGWKEFNGKDFVDARQH